jgi:hypothetical protein
VTDRWRILDHLRNVHEFDPDGLQMQVPAALDDMHATAHEDSSATSNHPHWWEVVEFFSGEGVSRWFVTEEEAMTWAVEIHGLEAGKEYGVRRVIA